MAGLPDRPLRRAALPLAAVAALIAGCTNSATEVAGTTASDPPAAKGPAATAAQDAQPAAVTKRRRALVTVVDGDTGKRVEGARVVIGREAGRSDRRGEARVQLARRGSIPVRIAARGYIAKRVRLRFTERRRYTVRIYQERLQWPFYGGTLARTQVRPAIRIRPPYRTVWSRGVGSLVEFPAAVWEGVAYVNTLKGVLYALSMRNGRVLWRQQIGSKTASTPAIDPESRTLLVTTMAPGDFQVRDLVTGELEWRYATGSAEPSPIVRDGVAYFAATNGNVYALDLARRRPRWVFAAGAKITSSPALQGDRLYVGDYAGRVFCLDARTGKRIWTGSAGSRVYGTVAVAGGRVFAPSVFSGLSALSARTGALLWRIPTGSYLYSSPAVYRGRVYFGNYSGTVSAAFASSGRVLWSRSAGGSVSGAIQVVDGVVYAGSFGGVITGWSWRTGRQLVRFPHGEYVAVSGNGGRLLLHGYSKIYAVEPTKAR